ncbi:hypothetical protein [Saccharopolyspora mangrovi]|uniref:DUF3093 domain-containing protein n=1 Tax=Saccharopolyspora mangrovi TaxID=3082379 RepID=A0ABU6A6H9_9PSEU|nr:hypothetical protein [Saccharopolyspora sp. S2-29]MEB3367085.1 hypothetical protein [Saccharopolyspora sp. S2-29]
MDFRRSSTGAIAGVILIALGVFGTVLLIGGLTGGSGVRIHFLFFLAPIGALAGVVMLINSLRPLKMRIDERGIMIHQPARRVQVALGWQHVAAVSVTELRKPKDARNTATYLAVWTHGGLNPGVPPEWVFQNDGWTGYRLIDVDDVRESSDQLTQALRQYAAPVLR